MCVSVWVCECVSVRECVSVCGRGARARGYDTVGGLCARVFVCVQDRVCRGVIWCVGEGYCV